MTFEAARVQTMVQQTWKMMSVYSPLVSTAPEHIRNRYATILMDLAELDKEISSAGVSE